MPRPNNITTVCCAFYKVVLACLLANIIIKANAQIIPILPAKKKATPTTIQKKPVAKDILGKPENNMVLVQGGTFSMGSNYFYANTKPVHLVKINSFYISKHEVTQALWQLVMGSNPSDDTCGTCPIANISWDDATAYCQKLSTLTGKHYRLPTEAEWEYAARGGNRSKGYAYSGSNNIDDIGWHDTNSGGKAHPVGLKQPNELGLYDMTGNVSEWCNDWFSDDYYSTSTNQNPLGPPTGTGRVIRGGSWGDFPMGSQNASRANYRPGDINISLGFRPVVEF